MKIPPSALATVRFADTATIVPGRDAQFSAVLPGEIDHQLTHLWKLGIRLALSIGSNCAPGISAAVRHASSNGT